MSGRKGWVVVTTIVLIGWVGRASAPAWASDAPSWRGAWLVADPCSWRHVGTQGDQLVLEGRVRGLDVTLRGAGDAGGLVLRGTALDADGALREAQLVARRGRSADALEVTLEVQGQPSLREAWLRPGAPALRLGAPGGRRGGEAERVTRLQDPGSAPLRLELRVEGRPQGVVLTVLAPGDPRYEHLGGVVHHEALGDGRPLAVGRHEVAWTGLDRSLDGRPVLPGRYRVVVTAVDGPLGAAPGEDGALVTAELALVVGEPPVTALAPAPPRAATPDSPRPGLAGVAGRP